MTTINYDELKEKGFYYLQNRGENQALKIDDEDINTLNKYKRNVIVYPVVAGFSLFGLKFLTKNLNLPSFFDNPLEPDERATYRQKFFSKFFKNQLIFVGAVGILSYYYVRYEISKYYMFLKYENLVNAYVNARDAEYMKTVLQSQSSSSPMQV